VQGAEGARTYSWRGELLATDSDAKTVTVRVKVADHVARYLDRFKTGDRIVLVWDMVNRETNASAPSDSTRNDSDVVLFIDPVDPSTGRRLDRGYLLPAEFVSGEQTTVTVRLHLDDQMLRAARLLREGAPIQATTSMHQPTDTAALVTIAAADRSAEAQGAR